MQPLLYAIYLDAIMDEQYEGLMKHDVVHAQCITEKKSLNMIS